MTSQGKKKQLVAILDDDVELCSLVGGILEDHDYEVMTFADPFEALYSMPKLLPDVVISDINMPKMDGYTFRQRFLEDEHLRDIPWIFLTARRSPEQRVEGIESGSDAYVTKPFLPRELVAIVKNVIQRLRKNRPLPRSPLKQRSRNRNPQPQHRRPLRDRCPLPLKNRRRPPPGKRHLQ